MSKPTPAGLANLGDFKPSAPAPEDVPVVSRTAAAAHGFVERDPPKPIKRRRASEEPTVSFTMRIDVSDQNDFIQWCDEQRLPYREGFKRIMAAVRKGAV
jgi:hypothetical protein